MNNTVSIESICDMTRKQFSISFHPEKRLQTDPHLNGSQNMPAMTFIFICKLCNKEPDKVIEFLRIDRQEYDGLLKRFEKLISEAKQQPPFEGNPRTKVSVTLPSIAFRKALLVRNFLRTKYRISVEV